MRRTRLLVENRQDKERWSIPFYAVNVDGVDTDIRTAAPEQPALGRSQLRVGDAVGFRDRQNQDKYGQVVLAVVGFLSATAAWLTSSSFWWLIGGVVLLAVIPFTLIVILPTNKKLPDSSLDKGSELASKLLIRWGRLHAVRSILGLISFLIFILSLGYRGLR